MALVSKRDGRSEGRGRERRRSGSPSVLWTVLERISCKPYSEMQKNEQMFSVFILKGQLHVLAPVMH